MEKIPNDKTSFQFKALIGKLFNANVNKTKLIETFGIARTTMKRWGDGLKTGDPEEIVRVFSGPGSPRKLTPDVIAFVEFRFKRIYKENRYNYSQLIREEVQDVFNKEISAESLRPIFNRLKKKGKA